MTPFDTVVQLYKDHPQEEPFEYYLLWHMRNGFVFSTPDFFIMGRPVSRLAFDPNKLEFFPRETCDAWFIHVMAGDMAKAWSILPWELPYLLWERLERGKLVCREYRIEDVRRLTSR